MIRAFFCVGILATVLFCCNTQRKICPAYQSAFVFDPSQTKKDFMLYNESKDKPLEVLASNSNGKDNNKTITLPVRDSVWDRSYVVQAPSLPIERRVKKDRYLLLPRKTYLQAMKALQTVPMKPVYPKKEEVDSGAIKKALDSAARSITDTLTAKAPSKQNKQQPADEVYVISTAKEKFNVDQDYYMWALRDVLVLPDVRLALNQSQEEVNAKGLSNAKKTGFFTKLKNLFKKKPKGKAKEVPKQDSVRTTSFEDLRDLPDSTGNVQPVKTQQSVVKKKTGLRGLFKKKDKPKEIPENKPGTAQPDKTKKTDKKPDAKKEDDGF